MNSPAPIDPRAQRALRLAVGTALSLALGFGLAMPMPILPPMLTAILLASMPKALPAKAAIALPLLVMLTTGGGLLLTPVLTYAPLSGVLLVALGLFLCLRSGQRGSNNLLVTFLVIGLTMISAAGSTSFELGLEVVETLAKGLLAAGLVVCVSHWLLPEAPDWPVPKKPDITVNDANWIALRGTLVIMPSYLLALINPAAYMPLIMQSVNLGQQACGVSARDAGRELLGSTLLGGMLAILFWNLLGIFTHLWMFFLLTLLFSLVIARRIYGLRPGRRSASFWLSSLTTMLLLLGQSVQDSASGKDVMTAFAVRIALFIAVTLYACTAVFLIDRYRSRHRTLPVHS